MLRDLLEGKPVKHPLHPFLIHAPIALFTLSLILDLLNLGHPGNVLVRASLYALGLGIITALMAAVPGLADWSDIRTDNPARKIATVHMLLNLLVVALYVVNLVLRWRSFHEDAVPVGLLVLSLVGMGILTISGYLGGSLVYNHGIGVGRHRRHTPTPKRTLTFSSAGKSDGWVAVADAASLPEGQTLRVEVDGCIMVLVNVGGQFHAFQDFCTHRFGPLSEGTFDGEQVVCPWHRSCFDVRTGKVTKGPAKEDLRTYEVAVREGQIQVRVSREHRPAGG